MFFMIAILDDIRDNMIGVRLLDTNTRKCMNVPYGNAVKVLRKGKAKIENLRVRGDKLIGYKCSIDDFTHLLFKDNNIMYKSNSKDKNNICTIVGKSDTECILSDPFGNTSIYRIEQVRDGEAKISNIEYLNNTIDIEEVANNIGHKIHSLCRTQVEEVINISDDCKICYTINSSECIIRGFKDGNIIGEESFITHNKHGWVIVDVYVARVKNLLKKMC